MNIIEITILAILQALTEFLPVSSSGHLVAVQELSAIEGSLALDVMLHFGTLIALVVYFRKKIVAITRDVFINKNYQLAVNIVISTIPAVIVGGLFEDFFGEDVRHTSLVAFMLAGVGAAMIISDRIAIRRHQNIDKLSHKSALIVGLWQVLALVPGTSRSGITILTGKFQGLSNRDAAEYSFLIGIPVIFGAVVRTLIDGDSRAAITDDSAAVLWGIFLAAMVGLAAIHFMMTYLKKHGLSIFGYYRIVLSLVLLLLITV